MATLLSDAEFGLKPAAPASGPPLLSDDQFFGASPGNKTETPSEPLAGSQAAPTYSFERGADFAPEANVPPDDQPRNVHATKIADAFTDAFKESAPVLTPEANEAINRYYDPFTANTIVRPGAMLLGGAIGAGKGAMAAVSQAAMEAFGEKGGRDVLAFMASLGVLHAMPELSVPGVPEVPVTAAARQAVDPRAWLEGGRLPPEAPVEAPPPAPFARTSVAEVMADNPGMSVDDAYVIASRRNAEGLGSVEPPAAAPPARPQTLEAWRSANEADPVEVVAQRVMDTTNVDDAAAEARAAATGADAMKTADDLAALRARRVPVEEADPYTPAGASRIMADNPGMTIDEAYARARDQNAAIEPAYPGEVPKPAETRKSAEPPPGLVDEGTTPRATAFEPEKEPLRLNSFLARDFTVGRPGDINSRIQPGGLVDTGGDVSAIIGGPKGRPGLLNMTGQTLDDAAMRAWENGYFPEASERPSVNDLLNKIDEDHNGNPVYSMHDQDAVDAYQHALTQNSEVSRLAGETGIDPRGRTAAQFFDAVAAHYSLEELAREQASLDAAHQAAFDQMQAAAGSSGVDLEGLYGALHGTRSLRDLELEFRQEDASGSARAGESGGEQPGAPATRPSAGQGGDGQIGGAADVAGVDRAAPGGGAGSDGELSSGGVWRPIQPDEIFQPGRQFRMNQTTGTAEVLEPGAPRPQPGGAQSATAAEATMSVEDMKANRRRAELDEIQAPPEPGDTNIYLEGSNPTLAEYSGDADLSQQETLLRERRAGHFYGPGRPLTEANAARVAAITDRTVPDTTLNTMRKDRNARWVELSKDIIPKSKPLDLDATANWVKGELADPRIQENDAVVAVLKGFQKRLYDADGNLKTTAAAGWGIHDQLQNQLAMAKDPLLQTGAEKFAESQILQAKNHVDAAMNVASDNRFQTALDAYAEDSKAINEGVLMNDLRLHLTNMMGDFQGARYHNTILNLAKERGDPGIDPSMDISDATMRVLINVDKDIKRAGLIKVGAPRGSQTNLMGALADKIGGAVAMHVVKGVPVVGKLAGGLKDAYTEFDLDRMLKKHLAPPPGGYIRPDAGP